MVIDQSKLANILIDLDRCPHGRHIKDPCITCQKDTHGMTHNQGNPYLTPGQRIGTTLYGQPIVVPEWQSRYEPESWIQSDGEG
jgi:hypothetical protein